MKACTYSLTDDPSKCMSAKQFGYFSIRWAREDADDVLKDCERPPLADIDVLKSTTKDPFLAALTLTALHGAAYWVFAAGLPAITGRISEETYAVTRSELTVGRDDCFKDICAPNGERLPPSFLESMTSQFDGYYSDILKDVTAERPDPDIIDPYPSKIATAFVKIIEHSYGGKIPIWQELLVGQYLDDAVFRLIRRMQHKLQISA